MKFDLTFCMPAVDMFENNDLFSEICYAFESALADGEIDIGEYVNLPFDTLCNSLTYNPSELEVEYSTWDMGTFYIYYVIPITLNV